MDNALTEAQFEAANDRVDALLRASKAGTPERGAAQAVSAEWEDAIALPNRTFQQRQDRLATIATTAVRLGLVAP